MDAFTRPDGPLTHSDTSGAPVDVLEAPGLTTPRAPGSSTDEIGKGPVKVIVPALMASVSDARGASDDDSGNVVYAVFTFACHDGTSGVTIVHEPEIGEMKREYR